MVLGFCGGSYLGRVLLDVDEEASECSLCSSDAIGDGVARLDNADEDNGDGVRVLFKFFEISADRIPSPGVLVLPAFIEFPDNNGDEDELGCFRGISVADKLFVLFDKLELDRFLLESFEETTGFIFKLLDD